MIRELRAALGAELERLAAELARRMAASFGEEDDGRTLAEEEAEREIQRRMAMLGQLVAGLASVDPGTIRADRAGFGSVVRVRDVASGQESSYTLMTSALVELDEGHVSLESPIGHALLGRRIGDRVKVTTPRGERVFEVQALTTLPRRLGLGGAEAPKRAARTGAEPTAAVV